MLKEIITNIKTGEIKEAVALVEWMLEIEEIERKKKNKPVGRGSPYNVVWRADLRFYLSQGLAIAGFKTITEIKDPISFEAMSRKNDLKKVRA